MARTFPALLAAQYGVVISVVDSQESTLLDLGCCVGPPFLGLTVCLTFLGRPPDSVLLVPGIRTPSSSSASMSVSSSAATVSNPGSFLRLWVKWSLEGLDCCCLEFACPKNSATSSSYTSRALRLKLLPPEEEEGGPPEGSEFITNSPYIRLIKALFSSMNFSM